MIRNSALVGLSWLSAILLGLAACIVLPVMAAFTDSEWESLFATDGAPEGWVVRQWNDVSQEVEGHPQWVVKDGVLHGSADRGTWLMSEKEYGDFELEFDFKLGELGNSGCALRSPMKGDPAFDGLELQMADFRYNTSAKPNELTGGLYRALSPREQVYRPTEWNHYHIKLVGSHVHVVLNDTTILDQDLNSVDTVPHRHDDSEASLLKDRPRRGHIGFQELSRGDDRVQIRNARLRVLDEK